MPRWIRIQKNNLGINPRKAGHIFYIIEFMTIETNAIRHEYKRKIQATPQRTGSCLSPHLTKKFNHAFPNAFDLQKRP